MSHRRDAKARDFYLRAAVHDDLEPCRFGASGRFLVDDADLQPDGLGAGGDGLVDCLSRGDRAAENVDDVDRFADLGKLAPDELAIKVLAGDLRIDRDDPIAVALKELHDAV